MAAGPQVLYFRVAYGYGAFLSAASAAGGSGGGDDPSRPRHLMSAHEADAAPAPPRRRRRPAEAARAADEPGLCPVCGRRFMSAMAVYGHMRSHPERTWRGMEEPRQPPPAAEDGRPYACERCGERFETRQALGGHRASHSGRKGCFWLSRNAAAAAEPEPSKPALPFDLNEPPPAEEEEEEEEEEDEE
ncbi:hypothetical protein ACP70R_043703 [Stipagrostis hirtigluma subsp. patula]